MAQHQSLYDHLTECQTDLGRRLKFDEKTTLRLIKYLHPEICKCPPDERTGETGFFDIANDRCAIWCCNICGERYEN